MKNALIAATTAVAIAVGSLAVPQTAAAAPFSVFKAADLETAAPAVEEVGRRGRRFRRHRHRRNYAGAAAAAGIIGLAAGAIIAGSAAQAYPRCRIVRTERWSPRYQAYVISREEVCH
ncbi:MAG: hypothetical protein AAGF49_00820 [Pseudomonadota bacterium]